MCNPSQNIKPNHKQLILILDGFEYSPQNIEYKKYLIQIISLGIAKHGIFYLLKKCLLFSNIPKTNYQKNAFMYKHLKNGKLDGRSQANFVVPQKSQKYMNIMAVLLIASYPSLTQPGEVVKVNI